MIKLRLKLAIVLSLFVVLPVCACADGGPGSEGDPAEDFANSISQKKIITAYKKANLFKVIDTFNQKQNESFKIDPDNIQPPENHHSVTFEDAGRFFILKFTIAQKSHTADIDDGEDVYRNIVFNKAMLGQVSDFYGLLFGSQNQLRLAVPLKKTCGGYETEGQYFIYDIGNGQKRFSGKLASDTYTLMAKTMAGGTSFLLESTARTLVSGKKEKRACEVSTWAKFTKTTTVISCIGENDQCRKLKTTVKHYEGCPGSYGDEICD